MGLFQKLLETYEHHKELVGCYQKGKTPLAPIHHTLKKAVIEITLNEEGKFIGARELQKEDQKSIIIPVTDESENRTGDKARPHPLCEQIGYLIPKNVSKYEAYVGLLEDWVNSKFTHQKLYPILTYLRGQTIVDDLEKNNISIQDEKKLVGWVINSSQEDTPFECWKDKSLFSAFIDYYRSKTSNIHKLEHADIQGTLFSTDSCTPLSAIERELCMVTGEFTKSTDKHPKVTGNAKLISSNDDSGFTYRGRFTDKKQAVSVGYVASKKIHNALLWLISNEGVTFGDKDDVRRTFICWNPQGCKIPRINNPIISEEQGEKTRSTPSEYREALCKTLNSYRAELPKSEGVVVASFDSITRGSGRLSLTYYNELQGSDFIQRLHDWDNACCWYYYYDELQSPSIQSPSLRSIVDCAFGTEQKNGDLQSDDRILRQQIQQLVTCRVDMVDMPLYFVQALSRKVLMSQAYGFENWRRIVSTACAVLNKYEYDRKGVNILVEWKLDHEDRDFQFGRLLAVMERAEQDYYKNEDNRDRMQKTAAIRSLAEFKRRPWVTYEHINEHLRNAYLPRIEGWQADRYTRLKDEIILIISKLSRSYSELNRPLSDIYLLGYDLQHNDFYTKKETKQP